MNIKETLTKSVNFFLILFVLFTVLPIKLNYSSITIIILSLLAIINLFFSKERKKSFKNYSLFLISIPFFIYALGVFNSSNVDYALKFLSKNLSFIAFPLIFFSFNNYIKQKKIYVAFLLGLAITNIYLIFLFFYNFNFGAKFYMIISLDIYHSTYLGMYNLVAYWVCLMLFRKEKKKLYLFFGLFFIFSAIITSARIIFILSFFSVLGTIFFLLKSNTKKILILVSAVFIGFLFIFNIPSIKQKFNQINEINKLGFDQNNYQSISSRFGKIEASLNVIKNNFWFGTGTGDMIDELVKEYKKNNFLMGYKYKYNPHNQFLDNIVRNGIIGGGICIISIYLLPLYFSIRQKNKILTAFILVISGVSLTESILDVHKGITFYVFFITLMIYSILNNKRFLI